MGDGNWVHHEADDKTNVADHIQMGAHKNRGDKSDLNILCHF